MSDEVPLQACVNDEGRCAITWVDMRPRTTPTAEQTP